MKYTSQKGVTQEWSNVPVSYRRTIAFWVLNPGSWDTNKLLRIVWRVGGDLVEEVKMWPPDRAPDGRLGHSYDLILKGGRLILTDTGANELVMGIEEALAAELPVIMKGGQITKKGPHRATGPSQRPAQGQTTARAEEQARFFAAGQRDEGQA